ncbi:PREDICTED: myeloid-derived growth factor [Nanorana parkeri]|uniref:myeloid-derived growth factor n=1 Tax=Nanorana parkeri TaxID=125878 RepID=UPI00085446C3|nr:PREDICTED: myeloid-derived growth factor [Nanorana parkeri]
MAPPVLVGTVLGLLCVVGARAEETSIIEEFDVKPGGVENAYTRTLGSFSCKFTYAAQGGTNEKWQMTIEMNEDKQYFFCTIWRPLGTSYLFFLKFKVEVTGGRIEFCEAYSQENKPLKKSEYDVTDTAVSHRPDSFSASLYKISVVTKCDREEL